MNDATTGLTLYSLLHVCSRLYNSQYLSNAKQFFKIGSLVFEFIKNKFNLFAF